MARLDVTDIVTDIDFVDRLFVRRRTETVGTDGLSQLAQKRSNFYGIVTNALGDVLNRKADGERIVENIVVHSKFRLIAGDPGITADIVEFGGRDYTVMGTANWSHFGRGFVAATCDLIPLAG